MSGKTHVHLILGSRCQQCRASVGIVVFTTGQPNRTHSSDLQEGFCVGCGLLNCGNAGSCHRGDVYQRVFSASHSRTFVSISISTKMKLLFVWGPRLCVESRSVEQVHHHNILVFSRSEDQVSNCFIEQLEYVLQPVLFHVIHEAYDPYAVYVADFARKHGTSFATTQWTVCAVAMKGLQRVRTTSWQTYFSARKQDSIEHNKNRKGCRPKGRGNQCASQVAVTWRSYDERKVDLDKIVRGA